MDFGITTIEMLHFNKLFFFAIKLLPENPFSAKLTSIWIRLLIQSALSGKKTLVFFGDYFVTTAADCF